MPKFLIQDEIYRLIQRELPEDVYPDGAPSNFKSTASVYAKAKTLESAYANLNKIYNNFFVQDADEQIADWETKVFGYSLDSSLSLEEKRQALLEKIRNRSRTTPADMKALVYQVIPFSVNVEIIEWNCGGGGWILDVSMLDISTILNAHHGLTFIGDTDLCGKDATDWGLSEEDFEDYQNQAYSYTVAIYNYTLTSAQREQIENLLNAGEPYRSRHEIVDGLDYDTEALGGES